MKKPSGLVIALAVTAIYLAAIVSIAAHHELWRDEMRALNIAAGAQSIGDLFALLRNEGHPPLWYLLLYAAYHLTHTTVVLKITTAVCAAAAVFLLIWRAPFPIWLKMLFVVGAIPLYQYGVLCRGYSLSMLLLFGATAAYAQRFTRPLVLFVLLALLANVNAYSMILAVAILLAIGVEGLILRPELDRKTVVRVAWGLALTMAAIAAAILVMLPDATTSVTPIQSLTLSRIGGAFVQAALTPGSLLAFLAGGQAWIANGAFWVVAITFFPRPWLLVAWLSAGIAFTAFSSLVYPSDFMQRGLLVLFFVALTWMDSGSSEIVPFAKRWAESGRVLTAARRAVLVVLLLTQIPPGLAMASRDLSAPMSSSESLGAYLNASSELRDAIIIPEPAVMAEALPYYARNRIYLPREGKDLVKVSFTTAAKQSLSLDDLVASARRLRAETGRPVLILMGHPLNENGPFSIRYPYGLEFHYSPDEFQRFVAQTEVLAVFDKAVSDENYVLVRVP